MWRNVLGAGSLHGLLAQGDFDLPLGGFYPVLSENSVES